MPGVKEMVNALEYDDLVRVKKDLDHGAIHLKNLIQVKIKEHVLNHKKSCATCHNQINPYSTNNFTLVFGPEDFRKKASFCAVDCLEYFLKQLKEIGFSGVQNFPTVGLFDGKFRNNLEATGMGYDKEVEMIRLAHEMDFFTTPYVFTVDEAQAMTKAGADLLVCHVGLTTAGSIGAAEAFTLDEAIDKVMKMAEASWSLNKDQMVICHGGPFDEPENVGVALKKMPGIVGFFGAPSIERLPTERAIRGQVEAFKKLEMAA